MQVVRPCCGVAEARLILEQVFGLVPDAAQGKELDSYCDRNFLLHCIGRDPTPLAVVLKIHNSCDSDAAAQQTIEAQSHAMIHLANAQIPCPVAVPSTSGNVMEMVELPSALEPGKSSHVVRCFKYIDGRVLGHVQQVPHCLYLSLGNLMGRVSASLASFHHPGLARTHAWSFETAAQTIGEKLRLVQELLTAEQRSLVQWAAQQWQDAQASGRLDGLVRQACHGDGNEMNVLVSDDCSSASALLDFGDLCETYAVAEAAITLTYALLLEISLQQRRWQHDGSCSDGGADRAGSGLEQATLAGKAVLEGYQQARPLTAAELAELPLFVSTRVALSLMMGVAAAQADPGNAPYLLMTQKPGWTLLQALNNQALTLLDKPLQAVDEG